jgi:gluconokinase
MDPDDRPNGDRAPRIVVMGVAGSGKTTVGSALAERLDLPYADADDFHPEANVSKMRAGRPLDDADRLPWLRAVGAWLAGHPDGGIVSCSALRRDYRDLLRSHAPDVVFLHLSGDPDLITARVAARTDHFMPASLVSSQLQLLEPLRTDEAGVVADLARPVAELVDELSNRFRPAVAVAPKGDPR